MKNVILILGILTTVMVYGVVAGVSDDAGLSDNRGPDINMASVDADDCRDCHKTNYIYEYDDNNKDMHHNLSNVNIGANCLDVCHTLPGREIVCSNNDCHHFNLPDPDDPNDKDGLYVDDHHDELDNTDCSKCHPQGQPKPL